MQKNSFHLLPWRIHNSLIIHLVIYINVFFLIYSSSTLKLNVKPFGMKNIITHAGIIGYYASPPCFQEGPVSPRWQYQTTSEMYSHVALTIDLRHDARHHRGLCWHAETRAEMIEIRPLPPSAAEVVHLHHNDWPFFCRRLLSGM